MLAPVVIGPPATVSTCAYSLLRAGVALLTFLTLPLPVSVPPLLRASVLLAPYLGLSCVHRHCPAGRECSWWRFARHARCGGGSILARVSQLHAGSWIET